MYKSIEDICKTRDPNDVKPVTFNCTTSCIPCRRFYNYSMSFCKLTLQIPPCTLNNAGEYIYNNTNLLLFLFNSFFFFFSRHSDIFLHALQLYFIN